MKITLKAPGSKRVKLEHEKLLSNFAFKFNLHHYIQACVGVLNHLRVPSGCLYHFVGSSECVLPTGACVTLPSGPVKSHMVMLQKGVVAVLPRLPQVRP
jgi:hypothetical protein